MLVNQTSSGRVEGVTLALKVLMELKHGESEGVEIGMAQQKAGCHQKGRGKVNR